MQGCGVDSWRIGWIVMITAIRTLVWVNSMILQPNKGADMTYYFTYSNSPIPMTTIMREDPINRGHPPQGLLSIIVDAKQQSKKRRQ